MREVHRGLLLMQCEDFSKEEVEGVALALRQMGYYCDMVPYCIRSVVAHEMDPCGVVLFGECDPTSLQALEMFLKPTSR